VLRLGWANPAGNGEHADRGGGAGDDQAAKAAGENARRHLPILSLLGSDIRETVAPPRRFARWRNERL
jgi:hypothetical protein